MTAANRPASITAASVLNIVFGGSGIIYAVAGIVLSWWAQTSLNQLQGQIQGLEEILKISSMVGTLVGVACIVLGLIAIVSGIGLLRMASWARGWAYAYALAAILINVLSLLSGLVIQIIVFAKGLTPAPAVGLGIGIVTGVISTIVFCAYPVVLLFFLRSPTWKTALPRQK